MPEIKKKRKEVFNKKELRVWEVREGCRSDESNWIAMITFCPLGCSCELVKDVCEEKVELQETRTAPSLSWLTVYNHFWDVCF